LKKQIVDFRSDGRHRSESWQFVAPHPEPAMLEIDTFCLSTQGAASAPIKGLRRGLRRSIRVGGGRGRRHGISQSKAGTGEGHNAPHRVLDSRMRFSILAHLENCAEQHAGIGAT
jgi:hypothetical protein